MCASKAGGQLKLIITFSLNLRTSIRTTIKNSNKALTFDTRMQFPATEPFASVHNHQIIILALIGRLQIELQYLQTQLTNVLSELVHTVLAVRVRQVIVLRIVWTHYYLVPTGDQLIALCGGRLVTTETAHCLVVSIRAIN